MLQNEEFMAELQKDSEFMSALEMEEERAFYDQQLHQKVWKTCCYTLFIRLRSFLKGHYLSTKVKKFWEDEVYEHFLSLLNKLQNNFYDQQLHQKLLKLVWNSLWKEHSLTFSLEFVYSGKCKNIRQYFWSLIY